MVASLVVSHCLPCMYGFAVSDDDLPRFRISGVTCTICGDKQVDAYQIHFIGGTPKGYLEGIGFYMCNLVEEDLGMLLPG